VRLLRQHDAPATAGAADPEADEAARVRAAVRADRARTELRHGRPVLLADAGSAGSALLVAAIETLDAPRWAALRRRAGEWRLLLSRERLAAIGWDFGAAPPSLALAGEMTLDALREFAAVVAAGPVDGLRLVAPQPAGAAARAALRLAVGARLAPALVAAEIDEGLAAALRADEDLLMLHAGDVPAAAPRVAPLRRRADAKVPLAAREDCRLVVFAEAEGDVEHVAVLVGQPDPSQPVPVRLHSSCLTGDLLGSLRCDCGDQLRLAIDQLAATGGVLLYLAQEGRGIGLVNKLRAYRLQDAGLDTFEADRHLGFRGDERDFGVGAAMLQALGIERVLLYTHNPHKIAALQRAGIDVQLRLPLPVDCGEHNRRYVDAKRRAGHYA
jgi:GTP cyclohydrolase II